MAPPLADLVEHGGVGEQVVADLVGIDQRQQPSAANSAAARSCRPRFRRRFRSPVWRAIGGRSYCRFSSGHLGFPLDPGKFHRARGDVQVLRHGSFELFSSCGPDEPHLVRAVLRRDEGIAVLAFLLFVQAGLGGGLVARLGRGPSSPLGPVVVPSSSLSGSTPFRLDLRLVLALALPPVRAARRWRRAPWTCRWPRGRRWASCRPWRRPRCRSRPSCR